MNEVTIGANAPFQNNHNANPEAGLEAIRMVLGAAPQSNLANNNIPEDGVLNFRADARKNLILATDEDSDTPFHVANRFPGQTPQGPNGDTQGEIDATAQAAINAQAFLNLLVNRNDSPTTLQYGDPDQDVSDADLLNFDPAATLLNLQNAGLGEQSPGPGSERRPHWPRHSMWRVRTIQHLSITSLLPRFKRSLQTPEEEMASSLNRLPSFCLERGWLA